MIRSENAHLKVAAASHPGMTGKNNEDRYAVSAYRLGLHNPTPSVLAVLCDGIGGHRAGEVAAELAVNTISQMVAESDASQPMQILQNAIQTASQQIYEQAQRNGEQRGMGATCACAWVIGSQLYLASVGDSRIYLQRGDAFYQLTTDHTWVQELLALGQITPEQARGHPNAHVIRRFLGSAVPPDVDFRLRMSPNESNELAIANQGMALRTGDRLLLCSDGLTDLVEDSEIRATLDQHTPPDPNRANRSESNGELTLDTAVQDLIAQANQRGGHDNITIVVMQVLPQLAPQAKGGWFARRWRLAAVGCLGLAGVGLVAGVLAVGLPWLAARLSATPGVTPSLATTTAPLPGNHLTPGTSGTPVLTLTGGPATLFITMTPTVQPTLGPTLTPWPTNTLPSP